MMWINFRLAQGAPLEEILQFYKTNPAAQESAVLQEKLGARKAGTFDLVGDYAAESAKLDPSMLASVTQPLAAAAETPLGPVATAIVRTPRCSPQAISCGVSPMMTTDLPLKRCPKRSSARRMATAGSSGRSP